MPADRSTSSSNSNSSSKPGEKADAGGVCTQKKEKAPVVMVFEPNPQRIEAIVARVFGVRDSRRGGKPEPVATSNETLPAACCQCYTRAHQEQPFHGYARTAPLAEGRRQSQGVRSSYPASATGRHRRGKGVAALTANARQPQGTSDPFTFVSTPQHARAAVPSQHMTHARTAVETQVSSSNRASTNAGDGSVYVKEPPHTAATTEVVVAPPAQPTRLPSAHPRSRLSLASPISTSGGLPLKRPKQSTAAAVDPYSLASPVSQSPSPLPSPSTGLPRSHWRPKTGSSAFRKSTGAPKSGGRMRVRATLSDVTKRD